MMPVKKKIEFEIETSGAHHCSNDCDGITWFPPGAPPQFDTDYKWEDRSVLCRFFGKVLTWDKRRKYNGYVRCPQCRGEGA